MSGAIECYWDDKAMTFRPTSPYWAKRANRDFVGGEVYHLVQHEPRSASSHNHYFAALQQAWKNLPEMLADRFPSSDHLRKYALIRTGWHNSQSMTAGSHAAALRLASFVRPLDEFAVVDVSDCVVTLYTAKTQSMKMGKKDFQLSKDDVLSYVAGLIGVAKQELAANSNKAA